MFPRLYEVNAEEMARDKRIREVLQRLQKGGVHPQQSKPTGDLRVWIHIGSKDSGQCVNVTVSDIFYLTLFKILIQGAQTFNPGMNFCDVLGWTSQTFPRSVFRISIPFISSCSPSCFV